MKLIKHRYFWRKRVTYYVINQADEPLIGHLKKGLIATDIYNLH